MRRCVCAEFIPIEAIVVDEGIDFVESLECNGMCKSGVCGVGVEAFPVKTIVANKVGDCAEDLIWYNDVWEDIVVVRRRRETNSFFMGGRECEDGEGK